MTENTGSESKNAIADQIYRESYISRDIDDFNRPYLRYYISVQLPGGQYDMELTSLKKINGKVSETFVPKEWHFKQVSYYENDDADGQESDRKEFQKRLKGVGLTIEDISKSYYHRSLLAGLAGAA